MEISRLVKFAFSGRAILFAGQDIDSGTTEQLRKRLVVSLGLPPDTTFGNVCGGLSTSTAVLAAIKSLDGADAGQGFRSVAQVPWAAVFTSSLDDRLSLELAKQDADGRRVRHLCLDEQMPVFFPRRNDVLAVLHLSHVSNEQTDTGLPIIGGLWGKAQRFLIPGVLKDLPQAIGPGHLLCIAGIGKHDPVSADLIAYLANELDPDNVYWFIAPSDGLLIGDLKQIAPNIHFIDSDFPSALEAFLATSREDVAAQKEQVLELHDLAVTVNHDNHNRVLTFRANELREFRRHLVILPDLSLTVAPGDRMKRRRDFIEFLSTGRQTPDWKGISEGYALERDAYSTLLSIVLQRLRVVGGLPQRQQGQRRENDEGIIFLAGPPASGRTVGLLWLGYNLRRKGYFVVQLLPSGGTIDASAIEQILRLAEGRGAPSVVVLVDRVDRRVAENLDRHLKAAGRRSLVISSVTPRMDRSGQVTNADLEEEDSSRGTEVSLTYQLSADEISRFRTFLEDNYGGGNSDAVLRLLESDPALFALLFRLIPDARANIREVIVAEYLALIERLASFRPPVHEVSRGSSLSDQLRAWQSQREEGTVIAKGADDPFPSGVWRNIATHLPQLVLLFSSLDEAISLNLLTKRFPGLLQSYRPLAESLESSGLFAEVALDKQNDIGLAAANPFVATLLLDASLRSSVARINLLFTLLNEFPWDTQSRSSEVPEQALLIHVLRSISPPSGAFQYDYQRTEDLNALATGLRELREGRGVIAPQLLLIEGIVLRHLGKRRGTDGRGEEALNCLHQSRSVLEAARDIVARRRPSPGRNFEIAMILTAISATIGHTFNAESRAIQVNEERCKELVQKALDTASESRAYAEAYHPLDTAFWTNRDFYNYLADLPDTSENRLERHQALLSMADALDKAGELGELPSDQAGRFAERLVTLESFLNNAERAQQIADEEARTGRFPSVCLIARLKAIDTRSNLIKGTVEAKDALHYLEGYSPRIMTDDRALTLMHRLWTGAHLGNRKLDSGPFAIQATAEEWNQLEGIVAARRTLSGNTRIPYVNFWLAVAFAQQGQMRRALEILEEVQANSLAFSHRRLTPLLYLSSDQGLPKIFGAVVRRREDDDLLSVYVSSLGIEVRVSKRYQGTETLNAQKGDEVKILVALNYWNPTGVFPAWEGSRMKKSAESTGQTA
jgi:hypothetical protein